MQYVPDRGDLVYMDFSPQAGPEQANRRPALVLSPRSYNGSTGLVVVVPITSKVKGYRFEVVLAAPLRTRGVVLSDQLKSLDWRARNVAFEETVLDAVMDEVSARVAALLDLNA